MSEAAEVRVVLPQHLQRLAGVDGEVRLRVPAPVTLASVLDALEARHPMLCGTIREHDAGRRRPMVRFFAEQRDLSLAPSEAELPASVAGGREPLLIIAAIAGG